MRSFRNTYHEIRDSHSHTLKFLNSSISFIDISTIKKRMDRLGETAYQKYLTEWEHSYLESLKIPKRKLDFLAGRMAGKRAVKRQFAHSSGWSHANSLKFNDIEIKRTVTGRPLVFIKDGTSENGTSDFWVSISHTAGVAASLVCRKKACKGIGIDIEIIEKRDDSLLGIAFIEEEVRRLRSIAAKENGRGEIRFIEEISRAWSIKEAVMKSMGVGVNIDLKDIEVLNIGNFAADVALRNGALGRFKLLNGEEIQVEAAKIDNFMVAIACLY